jgi:hypothetical protein
LPHPLLPAFIELYLWCGGHESVIMTTQRHTHERRRHHHVMLMLMLLMLLLLLLLLHTAVTWGRGGGNTCSRMRLVSRA